MSLKCPEVDPQRNLSIDMGFLQTAKHVSRLMKLGLGGDFHIQSHAVDGMKIGLESRFKVKRLVNRLCVTL